MSCYRSIGPRSGTTHPITVVRKGDDEILGDSYVHSRRLVSISDYGNFATAKPQRNLSMSTTTCADSVSFRFGEKNRSCDWMRKLTTKKREKLCKKRKHANKISFWCRATCATVDLGPCFNEETREQPYNAPTLSPSAVATSVTSSELSGESSILSSKFASESTTSVPNAWPTQLRTRTPIVIDSKAPNLLRVPLLTIRPSKSPTKSPTVFPTNHPTNYPTFKPSISPTCGASKSPTTSPTANLMPIISEDNPTTTHKTKSRKSKSLKSGFSTKNVKARRGGSHKGGKKMKSGAKPRSIAPKSKKSTKNEKSSKKAGRL